MHTHFGHYVKSLHWCTDQAMTAALAQMELTAAQGHILGYLSFQKTPVCSRDIEEEFGLSHPTVSGLLQRLEKKGFIGFQPDGNDRRCKRIQVLPKGKACQALMHQTICHTEAQMVEGFTPEEKALFAALLDRAITNMGGGPCRAYERNKEESET